MSDNLFRFQRRNRTNEWTTWLDTYVYLNELDWKSAMKRKEALHIFIEEGLKPFVQSHGYVFSTHYNLLSHLATYMYKKYARDFVKQPFARFVDHRNVDYDYYEEVAIPGEEWEAFWQTWGTMTDFYDDNLDNRWWVPSFCYNRLDLESSDTTNTLDKELDEEFPEEDVQFNENLVRVKDKKGMY